MQITDINPQTTVRHRDGAEGYTIAVTSGNDVDGTTTVHIRKNDYGMVFMGTVEQARKAGYAFGDEPFTSCAVPFDSLDVDALREQAEKQAANSTSGYRETAVLAVSALDHLAAVRSSLAAAQKERSEAIVARGQADRALDRFKEQVRDAIIAAAKEHDLCKEGTNSVLSDLGLGKWSSTWTVTVTDPDGDTILTVRGIEADDASDAEREVRDNFSVSAEIERVKFSYSYDGEGEADWDSEEYEADDLSDDDDEYASNHSHDLSYSADEE
jgi:hypothetical protein